MNQPLELWDIVPDNKKEYEKWIKRNMQDFIKMYIITSDNPEKNYNWLLNWIGKDCYDAFVGNKCITDCQKRKEFLDQYKEDNKIFTSKESSMKELKEMKVPYVKRISTRMPGYINIEWLDEENNFRAMRFRSDTLLSNDRISMNDYIKSILEYKNQLKESLIEKQQNNRYSIQQPQNKYILIFDFDNTLSNNHLFSIFKQDMDKLDKITDKEFQNLYFNDFDKTKEFFKKWKDNGNKIFIVSFGYQNMLEKFIKKSYGFDLIPSSNIFGTDGFSRKEDEYSSANGWTHTS